MLHCMFKLFQKYNNCHLVDYNQGHMEQEIGVSIETVPMAL